jgi:FdrA protein
MSVVCSVLPSTYRDSVTLMEAARELTRLQEVADAAVVMATPANKALLEQAGLLLPQIATAGPNDLVIVVRAGTDEVAAHALGVAQERLRRRAGSAGAGRAAAPRTLRAALRAQPGSNLAVISVAGEFAAAEAWDALTSGLHVLLFSDNVPLADEVALKKVAAEHDLLLMGPGCGTALLDGVALGFANVVPRGPVGIVAAAGTGLQEVSTLLARLDVGISQGIGTGGRDLQAAVGGSTMRQGLRLLQDDPQTRVLLLISKPPAAEVAARVLEDVRSVALLGKPVVVCFLGGDAAAIAAAGAVPAGTLQEAAYRGAEAAGYAGPAAGEALAQEAAALRGQAADLRGRLRPGQENLRGLFSGGTLLAEAQVIWREMGLTVRSNAPLEEKWRLTDATRSAGHCALDLGEEEFTVGRPHPMIDCSLRIRRLLHEAADPTVAVILLDVVLGYGAHPDPAGELGPAVYRARTQAADAGIDLLVVAAVTGTDADPQHRGRQVRALEEAGVVVAPCNAAAARLAGEIVKSET